MRLAFLVFLLPLVSGAATISTTTCTASVQTGCVVLPQYLYTNARAVAVQVSGTWTGTLAFEVSNDNVTWAPILAFPTDGTGQASTTTGNGAWTVSTGFSWFRVRATVLTSGSAVVSPQPTSSAPQNELMRVVGSTYGPVGVSGIVDLSSATLALMGNYVCTAAESHRLSLTTTPTIIPTGAPISNRTSWTVINQDSIKKISCRVDPGDGGVPDCNTPGFGITVQPSGGVLTFPVRESDVVRCVACTTGATVEHTEEACVAP